MGRRAVEPDAAASQVWATLTDFSGVLVPLFWRGLEPDTRRGFEEMNRALNRRADASLQGS